MGQRCPPPPPRKRRCGGSARHSGSASFPRGECTAANQAAGRGQRRPAGLCPTPNHCLCSTGRAQNLTCNLAIARFMSLSVPHQRYVHFVLYLHNKNPRHNLTNRHRRRRGPTVFLQNRDYNGPLITISELKCIPRVQPTSYNTAIAEAEMPYRFYKTEIITGR